MLNKIMRDAMARSLARFEDAPANWNGPDWWQLSPEESGVFDLRPQRWAEMLPAWQAFEFFRGRTDGWNNAEIERDYPDLSTVINEARSQHQEWMETEAKEGFLRFSKHYAGLSHREAYAVFYKMDFWEVRTGIKWFADELDNK